MNYFLTKVFMYLFIRYNNGEKKKKNIVKWNASVPFKNVANEGTCWMCAGLLNYGEYKTRTSVEVETLWCFPRNTFASKVPVTQYMGGACADVSNSATETNYKLAIA